MGVSRWANQPDQTTGYTRGANRATSEKGSGMGTVASGSTWHPTSRFLVLLVIAELIGYGALRAYTRHGG